MTPHLYYVVPLLVEQPTWGGTYIATFKQITDTTVLAQKIGQAFELYDGSQLTTSVATQPAFGVAPATDLKHPVFYGDTTNTLTLQSLIDQDAAGILGHRVLAKTGPKMTTLIKFTQAKNNSYQVHVKPGYEFGHWLPKPESWYYFEPGLITLGLKKDADVAAYQARCLAIDTYAHQISDQIKAGQLSVADGRIQLQAFIDTDHPRRFVNTVNVKANQVIDLSGCGIHHSWEIDPAEPEGNRCYEVQVDVKDENCTLRSFDQGQIKDDGSVRPLAIADYFRALDTSPEYNEPSRFFQTSQSSKDGTAQLTKLFANTHYQTTLVEFTGEYAGSALTMNDSFHHLFVQTGHVQVRSHESALVVPPGWSVLVPAANQSYSLTSPDQAKVLVTTA